MSLLLLWVVGASVGEMEAGCRFTRRRVVVYVREHLPGDVSVRAAPSAWRTWRISDSSS